MHLISTPEPPPLPLSPASARWITCRDQTGEENTPSL